MPVRLTIDNQTITVPEGLSVRKAALTSNIYIPGLCSHPDLLTASKLVWSEKVYRGNLEINGQDIQTPAGEAGSCNLCLVTIEGKPSLVRSCDTEAVEGLVVRTQGDDIHRQRQTALAKILAHHPHACLTCAQRQGCSLTQCSSNVPTEERCCLLLNRCELGKIVDYIGLPDSTPKYRPEGFPRFSDDPFFLRDYNLCIGCSRCVRICREVRGVDALAAAYKEDRVWIGTTQPGSLKESFCRFCGACVEVCPTGALLDKTNSQPVHHDEFPPCVNACPAGIDIPAYLRHIGIGDYASALKVIYDRVPFPGILGYVCFHPCESACKRETLDQSLAICALKRFVYEQANDQALLPLKKAEATGKKVAIIGSGPAGLTAAFYLARAGHAVEIYNATSEPGGMLRYAIPEYRLPPSVLDDELKVLEELGVAFHLKQRLGIDFNLSDLKAAKFEAIVLALGTIESRKLGVPGEDLSGVILALDFLKSVREGRSAEFLIRGKVAVIGGGNVAIDAAMTVRRLGAEHVVMVCLEPLDQMPAHPWEIAQATEEGITILPSWGPVAFLGEGGRIQGIRLKRCTRVFDENNHFSPLYDETDLRTVEVDFAIIAIGQKLDLNGLDDSAQIGLEDQGLFAVQGESWQTNIPAVFAAGDSVSGPSSVITAIASGRKVAHAIDQFLGGSGIESPPIRDELSLDPLLTRDETFHSRPAQRPQYANPDHRVSSFELLELPLGECEAQQEALRCLRCHLRAQITPVIMPPDKWLPLNVEIVSRIPESEGVYLIAKSDKKAIKIAGVTNLLTALIEECHRATEGTIFCWELDRMYSKRESELIQQHLQQYSEMPGGVAGELDDLF